MRCRRAASASFRVGVGRSFLPVGAVLIVVVGSGPASLAVAAEECHGSLSLILCCLTLCCLILFDSVLREQGFRRRWPWIVSGDHPKDETTLLPRCVRFLCRDTVEALRAAPAAEPESGRTS